MAFDLKTWELEKATPEGTGRTELDAPEGMAVEDGKIFVVDTANHRLVAFDIHTLAKVGTYPPASWARTGRCRQGQAWDQLNCPQDIAARECEPFASDAPCRPCPPRQPEPHSRSRAQPQPQPSLSLTVAHGPGAGSSSRTRTTIASRSSTPPRVDGRIGCEARRRAVRLPRVAVAGVTAKLLYVCEEQRIQALTLLGEPRIVLRCRRRHAVRHRVRRRRRVYCQTWTRM